MVCGCKDEAFARIFLGTANYNPTVESPISFCLRIQDVLNVCCLDTGMAKLIVLTKLTGVYRKKADKIPEAIRFGKGASLECFFQALCEVLVPVDERYTSYELLSSLTQGTSSIDDFTSKIILHGDRAFPEIDSAEKDIRQLYCFIDGLNPRTRLYVRNSNPASFEEAIEVARRIEVNVHKEIVATNSRANVDSLTVDINALSMASLGHSKNEGEYRMKKSDLQPTQCYFSTRDSKLKMPVGYVLDCNGDLILMSKVKGDVELFGAQHALDLLILRGSGEEIDWSKESEADRIAKSFVCQTHLDQLLRKWNYNVLFNKKSRRGSTQQNVCSLPNVVHELNKDAVPLARNRLNREETICLMNATGILCHVGTALCTKHHTALKERQFHMLQLEEKFHDAPMKSDDEGSPYVSGSGESRVSSDISKEPSPLLTEQEELEKLVQRVAHGFGLSRISSEKKWMDLKPAVQDKKVNAMLHLIDGICKVTAGEDWIEFRNRCVSKIGFTEEGRVSEIMSTVSSALEHCTIRTVRNQILSLVTGVFSEREIMRSTGCTSYDIRQAKIFAKLGIVEEKAVFHRERLNKRKLKHFVSFVALPDITMYMPSAGKQYKLESGETIELAKVVRIFSYREIYRMFLRYTENMALDDGAKTAADIDKFVKDYCFGFTTAHKLMEVLMPSRRKRLQCIDNYQADSIDAFEYLNKYTNELALMGKIDAVTRSDLLRRSRVSSNFISYDQRVHMERNSDTINHCLHYLLSDPENTEFASCCNRGTNAHSHSLVCTDCIKCTDVFDVFLNILRTTHSDAVAKQEDPERIRIKRMIDQIEISKSNVEEYRKHQIRAFASELDRKDIIENLQPKEALIISDFALKLIPTSSIEVQSAWYAKAGLSYHMSYCIANLSGELYHHSFGHSADDLKQDSIAVSAITEHVLRQLKENGVEKVYLRSDNAANYRNAGYLSTLFHLQQILNMEIRGYVFSEAQSGKGPADREIGQSKGKIRDAVNAKGNARNAKEVVQALTSGTLLKATSIHEIILKEKSKVSSSSFPGINSYGSFRFEANGIRARKFENIGDGVFFEAKKMAKHEYSYSFGLEGGHLSKSEGFWKKFHCEEDKEIESKQTAVNPESVPQKEGIFFCSDCHCTSTFLTISGLRKHELFGKHRTRKNSESTIDRAARMFAEAIETDESASKSVKSDSLVAISSNNSIVPHKGFAMKKAERAHPMTEKMKNKVTEYFNQQRKDGKRALAREISASVRDMKDRHGEYTFELMDCPKESQCQTLISTLLRGKPSRTAIKKTPLKKSKVVDNDDGSEESSDDDLPSCSKKTPEVEKAAKSRKRKSSRKGSLLENETNRIFEDDAFADFMEEIDEADLFEE